MRLRRLRRAYRTIAKIEAALDSASESEQREAVDLRLSFARQTMERVSHVWAERGVSRATRRRAQRRLARA